MRAVIDTLHPRILSRAILVRIATVVIAATAAVGCDRTPQASTDPRLIDHRAISIESPIPLDDRVRFLEAVSIPYVRTSSVTLEPESTAIFTAPWVGDLPKDAAEGRVTPVESGDGTKLRLIGPAMLLRNVPVEGRSDLHVEVALRLAPQSRVRVLAASRGIVPTSAQLADRALARRLLTLDTEDIHALKPIESGPDGHTLFAVDLRPTPGRKALILVVQCESGEADVERLDVSQVSRLGEVVFSNHQVGQPLFVKALEIGRELRESILLPTHATAKVRHSLPENRPQLRFGAVPLDDRPRPDYRLRVTVTGKTTLNIDVEVPGGDAKNPSWIDQTLDLSPLAGQEVEVAFHTECHDPNGIGLAVGSPVIEETVDPTSLPLDVVMISLDTVRADHLSAYGYKRISTPNFDQMATRGTLFENAISTSSWTLPAHVTLFTGQLPDRHKVESPTHRMIAGIAPLLAPAFRERGYETWACTGGGFVKPAYGFAHGYERFATFDPAFPDLEWVEATTDALLGRANEARAERARLLAKLRAPRARPLFLFAHSYVAHNYQIPPSVLRDLGATEADIPRLIQPIDLDALNDRLREAPGEDERRQLEADLSLLYDGGVVMADRLLGEILAALEEGGHLERTLLIITSDHGEELFERGAIGHRETLYEELIRVPLLICGPGVATSRVDGVVSLADVAPTVRELLQIPAPKQPIDGRSLVPFLHGETLFDAPAMSSVLRSNGQYLRSLRGRKLKLLEKPDKGPTLYELFHLGLDPGERRDVSEAQRAETNMLKMSLDRSLRSIKESGGASAANATLSAEMVAELKELGYLQGE